VFAFVGKQDPLPEPEALDLPDDLQLDEGEAKEDGAEEDNPFDIDAMKGTVFRLVFLECCRVMLSTFILCCNKELMPPKEENAEQESEEDKNKENDEDKGLTQEEPDDQDDEVGTKKDEENAKGEEEEVADEQSNDGIDDGN
jgi:midasin